MALAWETGAVLNLASGILVALLGAAILLANLRKDWNQLFGLFAIFWGLQIVGANLVRLTTDPALARFAGDLNLAFLVPLYFFLVTFAAVFPHPRPPFGTSALAVVLLLVPAAATLATLFLSPQLLLEGVASTAAGTFTMRWGPAFPFLIVAPLYGAFYYALFVMLRRLDQAQPPIERNQVTLVLAALGLFVAYSTPLQLLLFGRAALGLEAASEASLREARLIAAVMLAGLALLAYLAAALVRRMQHHGPTAREARLVLAALAAAFATAVLVALLDLAGGPTIELLGLVRIGSVALIGYGVARYQLFDIDLRVKRAATLSATVLTLVVLAAAAIVVLTQAQLSSPLTGAAVALAALLVFVPLLRVALRLADRVAPTVSPRGEHLYLRKLDVYRARLEQVGRQGIEPKPTLPELVALRENLDLSADDHDVARGLMTDAELRPGIVAFGKYEVERVLAEGGFGRVLLARDTRLHRPVVLKEVRPRGRADSAAAQALLREAEAAGQLQHPNIVAVHDVERQGDAVHLVLEYCPGGSLEDRLAKGPLPGPEALRITQRLLDALEAAHRAGIVHRDVKAANVLFDARDEPKLTDFGIAALTGEAPRATLSGLPGPPEAGSGSLESMSPEQAAGRPTDARTDVYAVGALLHRMLSGRSRRASAAGDENVARRRIAREEALPPIEKAPARVNEALARALRRDPRKRFPSARAFADALGLD